MALRRKKSMYYCPISILKLPAAKIEPREYIFNINTNFYYFFYLEKKIPFIGK